MSYPFDQPCDFEGCPKSSCGAVIDGRHVCIDHVDWAVSKSFGIVKPLIEMLKEGQPVTDAKLPAQQDMRFDGDTYDPGRDQVRLSGQILRVFRGMKDGQWRGLAEVARIATSTETSASARLRDLRKKRFGAHTVDRKRLENNLFHYRLVPNTEVDLIEAPK